MTRLVNDPATFTEDMLVGFLDANADRVAGVPGGVVRATANRRGKVAMVVGGGSGHYPAFCGVVGPGFADGAVVGNIFAARDLAVTDDIASAGQDEITNRRGMGLGLGIHGEPGVAEQDLPRADALGRQLVADVLGDERGRA